MMRKYKLIAFDWDGTIANSTQLIAEGIMHANKVMGLREVTLEEAKFVIGLSLDAIAERFGNGLSPSLYPEYTRIYADYYVSNEERVKIFPGMLELLSELKRRGIKIAVATGKARRGLNRILQREGLMEFFDDTICMNESASKPNPKMLQMLMERNGIKPEELLMVGDTIHDLQTAENAGSDAIAVSYGANKPEVLKTVKSLAIVNSVEELAQILLE